MITSIPKIKTALSKGPECDSPESLRQIVLSPARVGIGCTPSRRRIRGAPVNAAGRERLTVYRFGENSRYLLRKRSMLGCCFAAKRLFEVVRYVGSDKNAFAIRHCLAPWGLMEYWKPRSAFDENVSHAIRASL
jgi:hypothetical protein